MCPTCAFGFLEWLLAILFALFAFLTGGGAPQ